MATATKGVRVTAGKGTPASTRTPLSSETLLAAAGASPSDSPTGLLAMCTSTPTSALLEARQGSTDSAIACLHGPERGRYGVLGPDLALPVVNGEVLFDANFSAFATSRSDTVLLSGALAYVDVASHSLGGSASSLRQAGCQLLNPAKVLNGTNGLESGFATAFLRNCKSTPSALHISENCDADVRRDMHVAMSRLAASSDASGVEAVIGRSTSFPVSKGKVTNGTWQGVYLQAFEDSNAGKSPEVTVARVPGQLQRKVRATAPQQGLVDITQQIMQSLPEISDTSSGLVHMFCMHTSAALCVADAGAENDVESCLRETIPTEWHYGLFRHVMEGEDDMTAHCKSTATGATLTLPVVDGTLAIGELQRIYLVEHRYQGGVFGKHNRNVALTLSRTY